MSKVRWPEGLRKISLVCFNRPVIGVIAADCLQVLAFHVHFKVIDGMSYVEGTRGIFNWPLDGLTFPAGLRELFLGNRFNQSIDAVAWPEGLERLSMPGFNQPIQDVQWPPRLKTLEFSCPGESERGELLPHLPWERQEWGFDQPLGTFLPMTLETLLLSENFDRSLRGVTWPTRLSVLGLGMQISAESMDGVEWPPSLRRLICSNEFLDVGDIPPGCEVFCLVPDDVSYTNQSDYKDDYGYEFESDDDDRWSEFEFDDDDRWSEFSL